jgi:hypothetical protein
LQSIAFLASEDESLMEIFKLAGLEAKISFFVDKLMLELGPEHGYLLSPVLWSLLVFDMLPFHREFAERAM